MPDYISTGPRTAEGKAISSQNSLKFGLFAQRDFVRPCEEDEYEQLRAGIWAETNPQGMIEDTFASSIVTATWRLRRCGLVEADLAERTFLDPMQDEETSRIQASVDRARSHAHTLLRRSLAELRRLQSDRAIRRELFPNEDSAPGQDLTSYKEVVATLARNQSRNSTTRQEQRPANAIDTSFCKTAAPVPRNASCPCGSGLKHKRCCGKNSPAVLNQAA